jgi:hypothetical protein
VSALQQAAAPAPSGGGVTSVDITAPAAGITASGGPITSSGSITLALANDLAALEGLGSTGLAARTASDTWAQRSIAGTTNRISVTNPAGVAGDPTLDISASYVGQTSITTLGTVGTGTWQGTGVAAGFGGTGYTTYTDGDLLVGLNGAVLAKLAIGSTNQVLTVVGGLPAWGGAPSSALTATDIGYGNGSNVLTGTSTFTWTNSTLTMQMGAGTGPSTLRTANASSGANAASLTIQTGDANSGVVGAGQLTIQGGAGAGSSAAGSIAITSGNNPSTGAGGSVSITCGTSTSGTAGNFTAVVNGTTRLTIANTGAATFQSSVAATSGTFSAAVTGLTFSPTGSTAPADGMYLQAAGVVGLAANSTAAYKYGSNAFLSQTNNTRDLGESGIAWRNIYSNNLLNVVSDRRHKTNVENCDLGLLFINSIRPVSYLRKVGEIRVSADGKNTQTEVPGVRKHYGFVAQEIKAVMDDMKLDDFAGWCLSDLGDPDSLQTMRYGELIAPIVKSIQQLHELVKARP